MTTRQTPQLQDLEIPKSADIPDDVIPLFHHDKDEIVPNKPKILYDIVMLWLLIIDLLLMLADKILMSEFAQWLAKLAGLSGAIVHYQTTWHETVLVVGGVFTLFWVVEILVRWVMAVIKQTYFRWFFFPFVHWYEVLGCFPQLRALRLLRVIVIGYRLHQMGWYFLPKSWYKTIEFYYTMIMEEISDRVILIAIDNIRTEVSHANGHLVQNIIDKHRQEIETVIVELLQQEVTPLLQAKNQHLPDFAEPLSKQVGQSIQQALAETPELRRMVRLIPFAGSLIEEQMLHIGQQVGENLTKSLSKSLTKTETLEQMYRHIAKGLAEVDTTSPTLEKLVVSIIEESLTSIAEQVKVQQWKHKLPQ